MGIVCTDFFAIYSRVQSYVAKNPCFSGYCAFLACLLAIVYRYRIVPALHGRGWKWSGPALVKSRALVELPACLS